MFLIKILLNLCVYFLILSIPIQDEPLFSHIHRLVNPMASKIYKDFGKKLKKSAEEIKENTSMLFHNTKPRQRQQPQLQNKASSDIAGQLDSYTAEERALLRKVLEKN